jgi:hypothetical protein
MTTTTRIQLAAAAALLAAAPAAASAETIAYAAEPVAIQSVQSEANYFSGPYASQSFYITGLSVSFVNRTNVAANDVEFAVTRDGKTELVSLKGSYAPGVQIEKQLANGTSTLPEDDATVSIAKVGFADGSTWTPGTGRVAQR